MNPLSVVTAGEQDGRDLSCVTPAKGKAHIWSLNPLQNVLTALEQGELGLLCAKLAKVPVGGMLCSKGRRLG